MSSQEANVKLQKEAPDPNMLWHSFNILNIHMYITFYSWACGMDSLIFHFLHSISSVSFLISFKKTQNLYVNTIINIRTWISTAYCKDMETFVEILWQSTKTSRISHSSCINTVLVATRLGLDGEKVFLSCLVHFLCWPLLFRTGTVLCKFWITLSCFCHSFIAAVVALTVIFQLPLATVFCPPTGM